MEPVFDPFEVVSLFAEVIVGQLGFQVVAVGKRGRGGLNCFVERNEDINFHQKL